jgi:hypothetical protein
MPRAALAKRIALGSKPWRASSTSRSRLKYSRYLNSSVLARENARKMRYFVRPTTSCRSKSCARELGRSHTSTRTRTSVHPTPSRTRVRRREYEAIDARPERAKGAPLR